MGANKSLVKSVFLGSAHIYNSSDMVEAAHPAFIEPGSLGVSQVVLVLKAGRDQGVTL